MDVSTRRCRKLNTAQVIQSWVRPELSEAAIRYLSAGKSPPLQLHMYVVQHGQGSCFEGHKLATDKMCMPHLSAGILITDDTDTGMQKAAASCFTGKARLMKLKQHLPTQAGCAHSNIARAFVGIAWQQDKDAVLRNEWTVTRLQNSALKEEALVDVAGRDAANEGGCPPNPMVLPEPAFPATPQAHSHNEKRRQTVLGRHARHPGGMTRSHGSTKIYFIS